MERLRLHKYLASAGVGSRRRCEELIADGRVTVDGKEIKSMGFLVDPSKQEIRFDDERVVPEIPVYYAVWKPPGYLCTNEDPQGRRTVVSLVNDRRNRRLYTIGRLDEDSEGLIIVTNDGEFANLVAHPRYGLEKCYELKLRGSLSPEALDRARKGIWLSTGKTGSMFVRIMKRTKQLTHVQCIIKEGKNRQLRRIFAHVGFPALKLRRVRIGELSLSGLKKGGVRVLDHGEVKKLIDACEENRRTGGTKTRSVKATESEHFGGEKAGTKSRRRRRPGQEAKPNRRRKPTNRPRGR